MRAFKHLFDFMAFLISNIMMFVIAMVVTFVIYFFFDYLINPWIPFIVVLVYLAFSRDGLVENILKDMGYDIID